MHGVHNSYKSWLIFNEYNGLIEIPTYTNDILMADYLEEKGFDKIQVDEMRIENLETMKVTGFQTLYSIENRLRKTQKIIQLSNYKRYYRWTYI